jgi:hypothetical protein
MATTNTTETLNGFFKEVYAKKIENLIPDGVKLLNDIPFAQREKQNGNFFHQPVTLAHEHGVTFAGTDAGAFALNSAIAGGTEDAQVKGSQLVLRSALSYDAASRSVGGGQKAFEDSTKYLVQNMMKSVTKKLEIELLYGQMGYGTVASTSGTTITVTTAEWAPGIWAGAKGMPIEIRSSAGALRGEATVQSASLSARSVTLNVMPAGVVATDIIYHKSAYGNEFAGIHKILTNTGTLFNIDASVHDLWKGNTYSASNAALSFAKIQDAVAKAVEKGLESDVKVFVNVNAWSDLLTEQAALRQYDSSYRSSESENGAKSIRFHGQNGMIEIVPSIYIKEGYAYVLSIEEWFRPGSTEVTFKRPGKGDEFFRDLENNAGYELRLYADMSLFCMYPGHNTIITNIVN